MKLLFILISNIILLAIEINRERLEDHRSYRTR